MHTHRSALPSRSFNTGICNDLPSWRTPQVAARMRTHSSALPSHLSNTGIFDGLPSWRTPQVAARMRTHSSALPPNYLILRLAVLCQVAHHRWRRACAPTAARSQGRSVRRSITSQLMPSASATSAA